MNYQLTTLPNKLNLLTVPMAGAETSTVLVMFATGARYESREQSGLSHFLEHMFFKGSKKYPDTMTLSSTLDRVGAEFNAFTAKEQTGYWIKTAGEHIELSLDVVSDMLINPIFSEEEINREKGVICEELNMYLDNPMWHIEDVFEELLYGDTPAGRSTIGTKENINRFNRQDFLDYYTAQYGANSATLIIAGKVPDNIQTLVEAKFGAMPTCVWNQKPATSESQSSPAIALHYKETDQAHLSLGVRTWGYAHEKEFILKVLSIILGGTMSSRLFINLRERNGLAYYVKNGVETYTDSGYMATRSGVRMDNIEKAIEIIINEYKKLTEELVSEDELSKIKNYLHGKLPLALESSDEVAEWFSNQDVMFKQMAHSRRGILTPKELLIEIDKVTAEDIREVAQEIFKTENLNLAIIGPFKDAANFEKLLKI